jgi:hypothetical protein
MVFKRIGQLDERVPVNIVFYNFAPLFWLKQPVALIFFKSVLEYE